MVRGVGDDFGSGADLPEFMANQNAEFPSARVSPSSSSTKTTSPAPPRGSFRFGASVSRGTPIRRRAAEVCRSSRRSASSETKGYCYGWHFYQAADADLVISADDTLFGHPSFRYHGWGPRMWTWAQAMGMRKFQEMVFTGRAFTAAEMDACGFINSVVPRAESRGGGREVCDLLRPNPADGHRLHAEDRSSKS